MFFDKINCRFLDGDSSFVNAGWARDEHVSTYNRLYYMRTGGGDFIFNGESVRLKQNCTYLFPVGQSSAYYFDQDSQIDWIHFEARIQGNLRLFDYVRCPLEIPYCASPLKEELLKRLYDLKDEEWEDFEQPAILTLLLADFLKAGKMKSTATTLNRLQPVFDFIEGNLGLPPQTGQLADLLDLETNYFIDYFSRATGVSPAKYVQARRIDVATDLIKSGYTVKELAVHLGFCDSAHFCRVFKQYSGLTPRQYKHQLESDDLQL